MPTYEWTCGTHTWDVVVPMAERDAPQTCPICKKVGRRTFSPPVVAWFPGSTRIYKEKLKKGDPNV